jgi:protein-tyrosine-phosphatase
VLAQAAIVMAAELIAFIAAQSGMAERLMREHVSDRSGHCRVCSTGAQAGRSAWPCTLRRAAEAARTGAEKPQR